MPWTVTYVPEFEAWSRSQTEEFREALMAYVLALQDQGPQLARPYCDTLSGSRIPNLKELRIQHAVKRWYRQNIPIAESRFVAWQAGVRDRQKGK